jgi:hypothetical protein
MQIVDLDGRIIHEEDIHSEGGSVDLSTLVNGIYLIKIYTRVNIETRKILKI